jgi:enamine deaminase RidA (YjgF/YER057c/UK114 family)
VRSLISSGSPYENIVGYSRAVVQGDWCFVAGTTGGHADTNIVPEDVIEQTRNAFIKIGRALDEAGFGFRDVVRATYYFTRQADHDIVAPVLRAVFGEIRPAVTAVIVAALVNDALKVEIEITAFRG